jgi:hypothetical protein
MRVDLSGGADVESGALILIADASSFAGLSSRLRDGEAATIDLHAITGRPAVRSLVRLSLEPARHVMRIRVEQDSATLSGDHASFLRLADEIELFLEHNDLSEPGIHAHLDFASSSAEEALLVVGSAGLILAGPVANSA